MAKSFGFESTTDEVLEEIDLSGKRVVVTGVSAGLGVETARALVAHGATVAWLLLPRYIPLISSRIAPSGSLKQTTPIVAPSGPLIFLSGAKHWTFFACRSA
jgi:hypothetical protein